MNRKPFPNLDGREEKTRFLRYSATELIGGDDEYNSASYMRRTLACRAAVLNWVIENESLSISEITQANNAYLGLCKKLDGDDRPGKIPKLQKDELLEAIFEGTKAAIWQVANNSTDMPCADFYDAVKEGVAMAITEKESG